MVFLGSCFSAVWIVVANSWQQTPAGYQIVETVVNGIPMLRAEITDFWDMVFNPSSTIRLTHTLIGCFIMGGFASCSVSAFYLLKGIHEKFAKRSFLIGFTVATVFSLAALGTGHFQAVKVATTQPAKLAAFEALYETKVAGIHLWGWPNNETKTVEGGIEIPGLLSFLVHGNTTTPVTGLDAFPEEDRPNVWLPFQAFHIMVGFGTLFVMLTLGTLFYIKGNKIFRTRWLLRIYMFMFLGAIITNQAGWIAAETGRQPWIVYPSVQNGVEMAGLRTSDGLSDVVVASQVAWSIALFALIYGLLFCIWVYIIKRIIQDGPIEDGVAISRESFFNPSGQRGASKDV
jgi:cytochrome d ubiquinol oxidase subunit I